MTNKVKVISWLHHVPSLVKYKAKCNHLQNVWDFKLSCATYSGPNWPPRSLWPSHTHGPLWKEIKCVKNYTKRINALGSPLLLNTEDFSQQERSPKVLLSSHTVQYQFFTQVNCHFRCAISIFKLLSLSLVYIIYCLNFPYFLLFILHAYLFIIYCFYWCFSLLCCSTLLS